MPRKEKTCADCLNKGYLSVLGRRHGDPRETIPCACKHGRKFLRMWKEKSPPTKG